MPNGKPGDNPVSDMTMPTKTDTPEVCQHCGSTSLYESEATNAQGGYGFDLLPGLSGFFQGAKFRVMVCSKCGAIQLFADEKSRAKLAQSDKWKRV
jgi:predicted nucleic-acid-binding Zn-ribbon protein